MKFFLLFLILLCAAFARASILIPTPAVSWSDFQESKKEAPSLADWLTQKNSFSFHADELLSLSEDLLSQKIDWQTFSVSLHELEKKYYWDSESQKIIFSLLEKLSAKEIPVLEKNKLLCQLLTLPQYASFNFCKNMQVPVSLLKQNLQDGEKILVNGLDLINFPQERLSVPIDRLQLVFLSPWKGEQVLFFDLSKLNQALKFELRPLVTGDCENMKVDTETLSKIKVPLKEIQFLFPKQCRKSWITPELEHPHNSSLFHSKYFWFGAVTVLGYFLLKDQEIIIER